MLGARLRLHLCVGGLGKSRGRGGIGQAGLWIATTFLDSPAASGEEEEEEGQVPCLPDSLLCHAACWPQRTSKSAGTSSERPLVGSIGALKSETIPIVPLVKIPISKHAVSWLACEQWLLGGEK